MPYISKEQVKEIRTEIRKRFPDYKISVTRKDSCVVIVSVLSGPANLICGNPEKYEQINHFHYTEFYENDKVTLDFLKLLIPIIRRDNYISFVDSDYGNIPNFYTHISIGEWDRPYTCTKGGEKC